MTSNIPKIKQLDLLQVLMKLGYGPDSYKVTGNSIVMKDKGRLTNGWNGQLSGGKDGNGFLKCQSGRKPGRFEGNILELAMQALGLSEGETVKWFEENFPHELEKTNTNASTNNSLDSTWNGLKPINSEQIEYLAKRNIKYNPQSMNVRDYNGSIALPIYTENGRLTSFQGRNIGEDAKKMRYRILKGYPAKGLFVDFSKIDKSKDVFIVEGMTDYLTMKQFTNNVIGLVSKSNGIEEIKKLKGYKFILIPDNDLGGAEVQDALESSFPLGVFSLSSYEEEGVTELKDVNDFWAFCVENGIYGDAMLEVFKTECKRPLTNIEQALKKAIRNRSNVGWLTGEKTFDWATGGITPGTTFLINGYTSQGKTTWAMWMLMKMLNMGKRVAFYSLETDAGKMLAQVLGYHFGLNWKKDIYPDIERYLNDYGIENLDNLLLFDDIRTLDDIEENILENNIDVAFIDYAQIMGGLRGNSPKEMMGEYAKRSQEIARNTYTAIVSLSQIPKGEAHIVPVVERSPHEAMALMAAADTMINVGIHNGIHKVGFVKCKEGDDAAWRTEFETSRNRSTGEISINAVGNDKGGYDDF